MSSDRVTAKGYGGLFLLTLATLMFEILLTRIFSVTMWYHFAFLAISVAMFGMTVGALLVYLRPGAFPAERAKPQLALHTLLFGVAVVASFLLYLQIPYRGGEGAGPDGTIPFMQRNIVTLPLIFVTVATPFIFAGIAVTLALTKFPAQVSRLYAVDLAGAGLGCVLLIETLEYADGPTTVFVIAALALAGAVLFAWEAASRRLMAVAAVLCIGLAGFSAVNTVLAYRQQSLIRLRWVKGFLEQRPLYEKWNSFSRIAVEPLANGQPTIPYGWGISTQYPKDTKIRQHWLRIDAHAGTPITEWDGKDTEALDYLKWDVTNVAHWLRSDANVLVVGVGGGRDLLSALVFDQRQVTGVEINENIVTMLRRVFDKFTGELPAHPRVKIEVDEARSYIARQHDQYDILQVSLIDTWAATAAGAFVLSENSLYTREAWDLFLNRLSDRGVLSFSRWYAVGTPHETYRLTVLAVSALRDIGIKNPRQHLLIVRSPFRWGEEMDAEHCIATLLVGKSPFTDADVDKFEEVAKRMGFEVVLSPRHAETPVFERIASGRDIEDFVRDYPVNIDVPTDNSPFFFNMLRLRDLFRDDLVGQDVLQYHNKAVSILGILLMTVVTLSLLCIVLPLALTARRGILRGSMPLLVYFCGIGLGFMLVEIALMQRLIVFLGHPTYGLGVVLFAILLASGIGAFATERLAGAALSESGFKRLGGLLGIVGVIGLFAPTLLHACEGMPTPVRIAIAIALVGAAGFFMGMAFPLGMKVAARGWQPVMPWLWGLNGAFGVTASVLATALSLSFGISTTYWAGWACYAIVLGAFALATKRMTGDGS